MTRHKLKLAPSAYHEKKVSIGLYGFAAAVLLGLALLVWLGWPHEHGDWFSVLELLGGMGAIMIIGFSGWWAGNSIVDAVYTNDEAARDPLFK